MNLPVLHSYLIGDGVVAFSTTRQGGVSEGNYATFNINHYCGDDEKAISINRSTLCNLLHITDEQLVYPHQTHQTEVRAITPSFYELSNDERNAFLESVDAVMTDLPGVCIGVSTADCIPVLLYDEAHHAMAAVHAGWRGTVARIVVKTVRKMEEIYHTHPQQLHAVIGPGISLRNFEVGDEVYNAFREADFPMDKIAQHYPVSASIEDRKTSGDLMRWHLDLPECNRLQLIDCGLEKEQIQLSDICTYDRCDEYFSARRLGINSGRIFTGILLKE